MSRSTGTEPIRRGGQAPQFTGKSRGGNNTKIHGVVDEHMRLLALSFTAGNRHDNTQAEALIKGCKGSGIVELVANRAYDANFTRQACVDEGL
nr:transposase [Verrucomicrobium sp. BvORR034]